MFVLQLDMCIFVHIFVYLLHFVFFLYFQIHKSGEINLDTMDLLSIFESFVCTVHVFVWIYIHICKNCTCICLNSYSYLYELHLHLFEFIIIFLWIADVFIWIIFIFVWIAKIICPIFQTNIFQVGEKSWHSACLRCTTCDLVKIHI